MESQVTTVAALETILDHVRQLISDAFTKQLIRTDGLLNPLLDVELRIRDGRAQHTPEAPRRTVLVSSKKPVFQIRRRAKIQEGPVTLSPSASACTLAVDGLEPRANSRGDRHPRGRDPSPEHATASKRRKAVGGLRPARSQPFVIPIETQSASTLSARQLQSDGRHFPQRKNRVSIAKCFQPPAVDRLIIGIWEQIHGSLSFDPQIAVRAARKHLACRMTFRLMRRRSISGARHAP